MPRAAEGKERLSLLDWGGGPGHFAVLARALFPELELDYHSRDLPALVELDGSCSPGTRSTPTTRASKAAYDLVVASSSLQYAEDWQSVAVGLAAATLMYLYITRVPIVFHSPSFVVLQRAQAYGYETEYLGWVLSRDELLAGGARRGLAARAGAHAARPALGRGSPGGSDRASRLSLAAPARTSGAAR